MSTATALGGGEANEGRPIAERILPAALLLRADGDRRREATRRSTAAWMDDAFHPAAGVHLGRGRLVARRRAGRPGDRATPTAGPRRDHGGLRDLVAPGPHGPPAQLGAWPTPTITVTNLGDRGVDTGVRRDLPTSGGARRPRADPRATVGRGRDAGRTPRRPRHAGRGPPGVRRPHRRPLPQPPSTSDSSSRSRYDRYQHPPDRLGVAGRGRPRDRRCHARPRRRPAPSSSTSTRWTS